MKPRAKPHVALVPVALDALLVKGPGLFLRYSGEAPVEWDEKRLAGLADRYHQFRRGVIDLLRRM